jgi:hypothetical protein
MLCIGDLKDKPISDVWKFTQAFVVINRQSMFGGKSSAFIQTLFNGRKVDTNGMNEWLKRKARMFNKYAGKLRPETVARQADGERNNIGQVFSV